MDNMKLRVFLLIVFILVNVPKAILAKDKFSPAILVDDTVITHYELDQRARFYKILNFPGNHEREAKETLIDDRLKMRAAEKLGVKLQDDRLNFEMQAFAQRANLTVDQFAERLAKQGVDRSTWEDYIRIPALWFDTINKKFAAKITKNIDQTGKSFDLETGSELQVLLTEIIIPAQQGFEEEALNEVEKLRKIKSFEKFSEAASRYSVAPTRKVGGKIKWQNLSSLPSIVRPMIAGLSIGEVSEPLPIPGGMAIFQLRDLRESNFKKSRTRYIEYAEFSFQKNSNVKNSLISDIMSCDDLYSFINSVKKADLIRENANVASLSKSKKSTLSNLDENEFIFNDIDGNREKLIMLCGRQENKTLSKNEVNEIYRSLANKRLLSLANTYLQNLRQEARIVFK